LQPETGARPGRGAETPRPDSAAPSPDPIPPGAGEPDAAALPAEALSGAAGFDATAL
jgi:hypothetical protein